MNILMIGGPKFLGLHITKAALTAGHQITHFNRGHYSDPELPEIETIRGDRYRDLDKLAGRKWDAVIDTCGYIPQNLRATAEELKDSVERYIFISSISAYADFSEPNFDENAPAATLTGEQKERLEAIDLSGEITALKLGDMYGALKGGCEQAIESVMPGRTVNVRSGLIVGPNDTTDRFTYWLMRIADGGNVLVPGSPERFVQFIDVRDLAEWIVRMVENKTAGTFNVTGKPFDLTMGDMLTEIKEAAASDAEFVWVGDEFLTAEDVQPWSQMPLYLPDSDESIKGFLSANVDRALAAGLKFRPFQGTVRDTLQWAKANRDRHELKAGITADREVGLLETLAANAEK